MMQPAAPLKFDAIIVGGGPVGIALAIGLAQREWKVLVVERRRLEIDEDELEWTKSYVFGIDQRGVTALQSLDGVTQALDKAIQQKPGKFHIWGPSGDLKSIPLPPSKDKGYKLQRWQLISVLQRELEKQSTSRWMHGSVESIDFQNGVASTLISLPGGGQQVIHSKFVFGCDGINSQVRNTLASTDRKFSLSTVSSPSAGLVLKSFSCGNPPGVENHETAVVKGTHGESLTMLSFTETGDLRPLCAARRPNFFLYKCRTVAQVYEALDREFPQLQGMISTESVKNYLSTTPIIFSKPSWASKAATTVNGVGVALVGDALHHFPPDIGQGVQAGLVDVQELLRQLSTCKDSEEALKRYSDVAVNEAAAICRLVPRLVPYQYNMRGKWDRLGKCLFSANLWVRKRLSKGAGAGRFPFPFYPAPVTQILQQEPVLAYSEIWRQQRWNDSVLTVMLVAILALLVKARGL